MCCVSVCACVVWQTDGWTPLLLAASGKGDVEVVRALVGAGVVVDQATVRDHWGDCCCWGVRWLLVLI